MNYYGNYKVYKIIEQSLPASIIPDFYQHLKEFFIGQAPGLWRLEWGPLGDSYSGKGSLFFDALPIKIMLYQKSTL